MALLGSKKVKGFDIDKFAESKANFRKDEESDSNVVPA